MHTKLMSVETLQIVRLESTTLGTDFRPTLDSQDTSISTDFRAVSNIASCLRLFLFLQRSGPPKASAFPH